MALFRQGPPGPPFDMTKFLIMTVISIVIVNILAGILGIWFEPFKQVSQQVTMGILLMVVFAAVVIAFMIINRQLRGAGLTTKDLIFILLVIGFVIFLLIVVPNLFNLPKPFSVARLNLQSMVMSAWR